MKRTLATILTITLLLIPTMVHAYAADNPVPESYEGQLTVIPDENTPPHISYGGYAPAISKSRNARATDGPTYYWQASIGWFTGSCYSESWGSDKTVQYPIDQIEASVSVYEKGIHVGDDTDIQYNSYTARASYKGSALSVVVSREAYGTHIFIHSGYETMERESYAST